MASESRQGPGGCKGCSPFRYYLVFDVEATCEEVRDKSYPHEIIEMPVVVLDGWTGTVLDTPRFHTFLRPTTNPTLSAFCTKLTGIEQDTVDAAEHDFESMMGALQEWIDSHGFFTAAAPSVWACDGPWDVRDFVAGESRRKDIPILPSMRYWVDIRSAYRAHFDNGARGVVGMLEALGMSFEGREHSGMDDALNIARLAAAVLADGGQLTVNRSLSQRRLLPQDARIRLPFPSFDFTLVDDRTASAVVDAHPDFAPDLAAHRQALVDAKRAGVEERQRKAAAKRRRAKEAAKRRKRSKTRSKFR